MNCIHAASDLKSELVQLPNITPWICHVSSVIYLTTLCITVIWCQDGEWVGLQSMTDMVPLRKK